MHRNQSTHRRLGGLQRSKAGRSTSRVGTTAVVRCGRWMEPTAWSGCVLGARHQTLDSCGLSPPLSTEPRAGEEPSHGRLSWPGPCPGPRGELGGQVQAPPLPLGEHWGWPESLILSLCTSKPGAQMESGLEQGPRWGGDQEWGCQAPRSHKQQMSAD